MLHFKTFCACNESARCFAQIGNGVDGLRYLDKPECKILLTPYPEGKRPFYKRNASDKPRIVKKEAAPSD